VPEVSLIVPVYRVEEYLRECLDSILSQDFQDFELIAINDSSLTTA
jgi:glycosyltransferase involved in cell wall biosynthesis